MTSWCRRSTLARLSSRVLVRSTSTTTISRSSPLFCARCFPSDGSSSLGTNWSPSRTGAQGVKRNVFDVRIPYIPSNCLAKTWLSSAVVLSGGSAVGHTTLRARTHTYTHNTQDWTADCFGRSQRVPQQPVRSSSGTSVGSACTLITKAMQEHSLSAFRCDYYMALTWPLATP